MALLLNGDTIIAHQNSVIRAASNVSDITLTTIYALSVNDYIEMRIYQDSGGALNSLANVNYAPELSMARVLG